MTTCYMVLIGVIVLLVVCAMVFKCKKGSGGSLPKPYRKLTKFELMAPHDKKNPKKKKSAKLTFVFEFEGDMKASQRFELSHFVDEVLFNKEIVDKVILKVESGGGSVAHYGHCMSEVERLRDAHVSTWVCVDTVAASGGYLMSLPADRIYAAPYAMVGSIGVMSFVPNFRGLLEKLAVEPRTFTAGKYKRTVTMTDNATPEDVAHYQEKLEAIHHYFISVVKKYRPSIETDNVCTGDYWLALETVEKKFGLIDEIKTSAEILMDINREQTLVYYKTKKGISVKLKSLLSSVKSLIWGVSDHY
jgi:serine protease SohB